MTLSEMRSVVSKLASDATRGGEGAWSDGIRTLEQLDGRSWLLLDEAARSYDHGLGVPVSGTRGWWGVSADEPTGFVAAVTSLHVDGRFRERATHLLAGKCGRVATTALAVRLLDHVPQVRDQATRALLPKLTADSAAGVLDVLLAGRGRRHAPAALESVQNTLLAGPSVHELVATLLVAEERHVRRWAVVLGHERDVLTSEQLMSAVHSDEDQWVRAVCADWFAEIASPQQLVELLSVKNIEARLVAVTRVPDVALSDGDLEGLLADRAPRVREQARWRARRRGMDAAAWYRSQLDPPTAEARTVAACLDGLSAVGGNGDLAVFVAHLQRSSVRVQAAAVNGVRAHADRGEAIAILEPLLVDSSPRVASVAVRALVRLQAPKSTAALAWVSSQAWSRRAAWRLSRRAGSWDRVEAHLRAAADVDPHLAGLGVAGIQNWLKTSAATTWAVLPEEQRERIDSLMKAGPVDEHTIRQVAFHARITLPSASVLAPEQAAPEKLAPEKLAPEQEVSATKRRWLRLVARR